MEWNNTRFDAEAQEERHKRDSLLAAGQMHGSGVKAREVRTPADLDQ